MASKKTFKDLEEEYKTYTFDWAEETEAAQEPPPSASPPPLPPAQPGPSTSGKQYFPPTYAAQSTSPHRWLHNSPFHREAPP